MEKELGKLRYGRTMLEMLGVLAVIGVLSLMAMFGYEIGMRQYHANEILNNARLLGGEIIHRDRSYEIGTDIVVDAREDGEDFHQTIPNQLGARQEYPKEFAVVVSCR